MNKYDEQRYEKPKDINKLIMYIDGKDGVRYYLCHDEKSNVIVIGGASPFMAMLDYVVANGMLHAMTDDGKILDYQMDYDVWISFREYSGIYKKPPKSKYRAWLDS